MVKRVDKKTTLVKDVVGKVRTSTRDLPPSYHTYGAFVNKDIEGVGAGEYDSNSGMHVISSWRETKKSASKTSDRNLIKTNVLAIDCGNITAKDMRLFAQASRHRLPYKKAHPEIRFPILNHGGRKKDKIPFDGPYGLEPEKMPWPLSALIEARFTDFSREGKDYPDVSVLTKKLRISTPRATKASQGHNVTLKPPPKEKSTVRTMLHVASPSLVCLGNYCDVVRHHMHAAPSSPRLFFSFLTRTE
ncbi:unnamed protein product [Ascophyllum nodosum]